MQLSPVNIEERKKMDIKAGDTVRIWQRVQEGKKSRLQAFEGLIIARKHKNEPGATFTIRKISGGIGVEITLPIFSPKIEKVELISRPKRVRRAKLYYLRARAARQVRKKMRQMKQIREVVMETKKEPDPAPTENVIEVAENEKEDDNKSEGAQKDSKEEK
ncbi:50S ribosomal protein L19 [Patescibacteria group bacterium]